MCLSYIAYYPRTNWAKCYSQTELGGSLFPTFVAALDDAGLAESNEREAAQRVAAGTLSLGQWASQAPWSQPATRLFESVVRDARMEQSCYGVPELGLSAGTCTDDSAGASAECDRLGLPACER